MTANSMFSVKKPCKDCPFRKDGVMNKSLEEGRMEEIIDSLHNDLVFSCHKTIDYDKQDNEGGENFELQPENKFCAGAMLYLIKEGKPNRPMQLGERLGMFDPEGLKGIEEIIEVIPMLMPWERLREQYKRERV